MQLGDPLTCVQHHLPVKIIVVRNDTLGLIKWEQMVFLGNPEYGVNIAPLDFVKFAESCGAYGARVTEPSQCVQALRTAFAHDGPAIIEMVVDPHEPPMPAKVKKDQVIKLFSALKAAHQTGTGSRCRWSRTCWTSRALRPAPGTTSECYRWTGQVGGGQGPR